MSQHGMLLLLPQQTAMPAMSALQQVGKYPQPLTMMMSPLAVRMEVAW
jgi:hypothetical protein